MLTLRFNDLPEYAFPRLRALLDRDSPGGEIVDMSIGEPKHAIPDFVGDILNAHVADYSRYPPIDGTPSYREAVASWYTRRFGLEASTLDPDANILPLNGTREGLFMAVMALADSEKNGQRAVVLIPNPFYQCYAAAALAIGAEPVFVPATAENGWMPDFASLPEDILARTTFAFYCSPSNPQGAVANSETLAAVAQIAETYDFVVGFDECYSEIYRDDPNSLSKRSNLAGLRSGIAIGGANTIRQMKRLRAYSGAPSPVPVLHAAEACWRDETHVEASRALYREKYALADEILGGKPGYQSPEAGFFLWLDVGDGEAVAKSLWRETGVKCLPGSYLGRGDPRFIEGRNPGASYLRAAMVAPPDAIRPGLEALGALLDRRAEGAVQ